MQEVSKSINVSLFRGMVNETSSEESLCGLGSVTRSSFVTLETKGASVQDRKVKHGKWCLNATRVHRPPFPLATSINTVIEDEELTETSELTQF